MEKSVTKHLLGAHVSTAGGLVKGIGRGAELGCKAIQLFTKNSNQWLATPLSKNEIDSFQEALSGSGIKVVAAHSGYLINLATVNPSIQQQSVESILQELERAEALELPMLVVHPGSHKEAGELVGILQVVENLRYLLKETEGYRVQIILETTAGQGSSIGHTLEHLAEILDRIEEHPRIGICVDTGHVFQAGYDIRTKEGYDAMWREFEEMIGLKHLKLMHLNDSMKKCGSRVDRHQHIGKGEIGLEPFRWLLNDKRFAKVPMVIETPKGAGLDEDRENLKLLRGLIK